MRLVRFQSIVLLLSTLRSPAIVFGLSRSRTRIQKMTYFRQQQHSKKELTKSHSNEAVPITALQRENSKSLLQTQTLNTRSSQVKPKKVPSFLSIGAYLNSHIENKIKATIAPSKGPDPPILVDRGQTYILIKWKAINGTSPILWNVLLNEVSVYSGRKKVWEQTGLAIDTCYSFRIAYFENGQWSQFSRERRIATRVKKSVDLQALEALGEVLRNTIEKEALSPLSKTDCPLQGVRSPGYVGGDDHAVEWIGLANPLSSTGVDAGEVNCKIVDCEQGSSTVKSLQVKKIGILRLRLDNGEWQRTKVQVSAGSNVLELTDPILGMAQGTIDLKGCRANELNQRAMKVVDRLPPATNGCFEVNCTYTGEPLYFCGGHDFGTSQRDEWMTVLNRHTHSTHVISRYEVSLKSTHTMPVDLQYPKSVYEEVAYREAWTLSWVQRLTQIGASPHFPILYDFYRCLDLPKPFHNIPGEAMGYLPPEAPGANADHAALMMKTIGGDLNTVWAVTTTEAYSLTMQTLSSQYKDYSVSEKFVQGIMFQLLHALGVSRKVFGLHHNDLLTLSNIRFKQIPFSVGASHWCYLLNDAAYIDVEDGGPVDITKFSNFTFGELADSPDACEPPPPKMKHRDSWCIPTDDVDGLQLKLYGFHNSAITRMELAYWVRGWTFMNNPWKDDLKDVSVIMCEMLGDKIALPTKSFRDLCKDLYDGKYKKSPLRALLHPFFDNLPKKDSLNAAQVDNFLYMPKFPLNYTEAITSQNITSYMNTTLNTTMWNNSTDFIRNLTMPLKQRVNSNITSNINGTLNSSLSAKLEPDQIYQTELPPPPQPWIKEYEAGSLEKGTTGRIKIAYKSPKISKRLGPVSMFQLMLNGVSVYSGPANKGSDESTIYIYEMTGIKPSECYRFQVSYFGEGAKKWSQLSSRLWINDCYAFREKLCREKGCNKGGTSIGSQIT